MGRRDRDAEIVEVTNQINALLTDLALTVAELNTVLTGGNGPTGEGGSR